MAVKPIPDGYEKITPYLIIRGAAKAIEFYKQAFGATEKMRMAMPDAEGSGQVPAWEPASGWREAGPGHAVRCWRELPGA